VPRPGGLRLRRRRRGVADLPPTDAPVAYAGEPDDAIGHRSPRRRLRRAPGTKSPAPKAAAATAPTPEHPIDDKVIVPSFAGMPWPRPSARRHRSGVELAFDESRLATGVAIGQRPVPGPYRAARSAASPLDAAMTGPFRLRHLLEGVADVQGVTDLAPTRSSGPRSTSRSAGARRFAQGGSRRSVRRDPGAWPSTPPLHPRRRHAGARALVVEGPPPSPSHSPASRLGRQARRRLGGHRRQPLWRGTRAGPDGGHRTRQDHDDAATAGPTGGTCR